MIFFSLVIMADSLQADAYSQHQMVRLAEFVRR